MHIHPLPEVRGFLWENDKRQCYNISKHASSPHKGLKHTASAKKKMKAARKNRIFSAMTKAKMSKSLKGKRGVITPSLCSSVCQYDLEGNFMKKYQTLSDAARELINNFPSKKMQTIRKCIGIVAKDNYFFPAGAE